MSKRIYVGNLSYTTTEDELEELFTTYGDVMSCTIPAGGESGRTRGFGFVDMSEEDAAKAIEALNGQDFGGRDLRVSEARPREDRGSRL
jgi:RNA recognition motif-containing protein